MKNWLLQKLGLTDQFAEVYRVLEREREQSSDDMLSMQTDILKQMQAERREFQDEIVSLRERVAILEKERQRPVVEPRPQRVRRFSDLQPMIDSHEGASHARR